MAEGDVTYYKPVGGEVIVYVPHDDAGGDEGHTAYGITTPHATEVVYQVEGLPGSLGNPPFCRVPAAGVAAFLAALAGSHT